MVSAVGPECAVCGRPVRMRTKQPPGMKAVHYDCAELRAAGARYARGLEDEPLETYTRAQKAHPEQVIVPQFSDSP